MYALLRSAVRVIHPLELCPLSTELLIPLISQRSNYERILVKTVSSYYLSEKSKTSPAYAIV